MVLASVIYKNEKNPNKRFPGLADTRGTEPEVPLFLYVFFSKRNCKDCLEIIQALNNLPPHFIVSGVVPDRELTEEKVLRDKTGATFPLMGAKKYKKFVPWYMPGVIGVSPGGDILFVLPVVPGVKTYLKNFLDSLYERLYPIFLNEKTSK